jgi:uncharacterized membrane protein
MTAAARNWFLWPAKRAVETQKMAATMSAYAPRLIIRAGADGIHDGKASHGWRGDGMTQATLPERTFGQRLLPNEALAAASLVLALAAIAAIVRGKPHWGDVRPLVWVHLGSIVFATALTPVMLLRAKGTGRHRQLGYVWFAAMLLAAVSSLFFNVRTDGTGNWGVFSGDFSPIHLLSFWVLFQAPLIVLRARAHDRSGHEQAVRGMVIGALLIAGFFTFPFGRMLGTWLFG